MIVEACPELVARMKILRTEKYRGTEFSLAKYKDHFVLIENNGRILIQQLDFPVNVAFVKSLSPIKFINDLALLFIKIKSANRDAIKLKWH